jgi:hypothetical protein
MDTYRKSALIYLRASIELIDDLNRHGNVTARLVLLRVTVPRRLAGHIHDGVNLGPQIVWLGLNIGPGQVQEFRVAASQVGRYTGPLPVALDIEEVQFYVAYLGSVVSGPDGT